jgi:hypothetical protein
LQSSFKTSFPLLFFTCCQACVICLQSSFEVSFLLVLVQHQIYVICSQSSFKLLLLMWHQLSLDLCNCKPSSSFLFCYEILEIIKSSYIYIFNVVLQMKECLHMFSCQQWCDGVDGKLLGVWILFIIIHCCSLKLVLCSLELLFNTIVVQWNFYFLARSYGSSLNEGSKRVINKGINIFFFLCQRPIELYWSNPLHWQLYIFLFVALMINMKINACFFFNPMFPKFSFIKVVGCSPLFTSFVQY